MKKLAILAMIPLCLVACARLPLAPLQDDRDSKQFAAGDETATLYVYQKSRFYAMPLDVFFNGALLGRNAKGTFLVVKAPPGEHTITSRNTEEYSVRKATVQVTVKAGEIVFISQRWHPRIGGDAASTLTVVDEETGKNDVRNCKLLQNDL